jgi:hypothetical protein
MQTLWGLFFEGRESVFQLLDEEPSVLAMKQLQQELVLIENRQVH